jgi:hypothetical protein
MRASTRRSSTATNEFATTSLLAGTRTSTSFADAHGVALAAGDAAEIEKEGAIEISNADRAEILVFDLD